MHNRHGQRYCRYGSGSGLCHSILQCLWSYYKSSDETILLGSGWQSWLMLSLTLRQPSYLKCSDQASAQPSSSKHGLLSLASSAYGSFGNCVTARSRRRSLESQSRSNQVRRRSRRDWMYHVRLPVASTRVLWAGETRYIRSLRGKETE